jgi:hypothetical protein
MCCAIYIYLSNHIEKYTSHSNQKYAFDELQMAFDELQMAFNRGEEENKNERD